MPRYNVRPIALYLKRKTASFLPIQRRIRAMCRNRILLVCGLAVLFCAPGLWAQCSAVTSDGTAVANQVSKFTTGCNIEPSAITETGGKVGIGTAAPAATLDVKGTATIRGTLQLPSTGTAT